MLVIEDDEIQLSVLKAALEAQGYDVETASDGVSGVQKMREGGFDLALIDYELPGIDGLATAWLIGDPLNDLARPCLVALTAAPDRLASRTAPHKMFDEVVAKQVGLPAVLATVAQQLRSAPDNINKLNGGWDSLFDTDLNKEVARQRVLRVRQQLGAG